MKLSDYIVEYLYDKGIKDFFGYQGTMVAHFIDSIGKNKNVNNHICYNEQGAALEAVGYAKTTGNLSCAYSTSGPGATNLVTGIADAFYDSVPVLFITGQLNLYEYTDNKDIRQQGFQEANIVKIVEPIIKYSVQITDPKQILKELEKSIYIATTGRKGPVLIDIPMDIQRADIDVKKLEHFETKTSKKTEYNIIAKNILDKINNSNRPILLLGNGIEYDKDIIDLVDNLKIPVLYSMLAKSLLPADNKFNFGFLGTAYGERYANIIGARKADLIVSLGCRMNSRTIGFKKNKFNENAKIIRIDIDENELKSKIHDDEEEYNCDVNVLIKELNKEIKNYQLNFKQDWFNVCEEIKNKLKDIDKDRVEFIPNKYVEVINKYLNSENNVYVDVGQNQIWAAHSIKLKKGQKIIFSGGLGAMGFALPAAIGGTIASKTPSIVIAGDGGMQMNIQELQTLKVEKLPITIFVFNNESLGLIHQQQCDFFENNYFGACAIGKYEVPDFCKIANAYEINSCKIRTLEELNNFLEKHDFLSPTLVEIMLPVGTKAYPKTFFGNEMINQRPEINQELLNYLLNL